MPQTGPSAIRVVKDQSQRPAETYGLVQPNTLEHQQAAYPAPAADEPVTEQRHLRRSKAQGAPTGQAYSNPSLYYQSCKGVLEIMLQGAVTQDFVGAGDQ